MSLGQFVRDCGVDPRGKAMVFSTAERKVIQINRYAPEQFTALFYVCAAWKPQTRGR